MNRETREFLAGYLGNYKGRMVLAVLLSVLSILVGFLPYYAVYDFMAVIVNGGATGSALMFLLLGSALGYLLKIVLFEFSTTVSHRTAYSVLERIRRDLSEKLMKVPLGYVEDEPIGKLKNLMIDQTETMELPLAHLIPEGTAYVLAPIAVFIALLCVHPLMALSSLVSFILGMIASMPMMKGMNENYDAYMESNNEMNSTVVEYLEGIEVIKTFNQSDSSYRKFTDSIHSFKDLTLKWFRSTWLGGNLMMAIMPSTLIGVLPVGMLLYMKGSLAPEELVLSIVLSMALIGPLMGLSTYMNSLKAIQYAAENLDKVLKMPELGDSRKGVKLESHDITFENVGFSYHEGDGRKVIDNLSFTVKEGEFAALIGPSGGGKSTIARLISRFWDVTEGKVKIGGVDVRDIPLSELSHYISYVAQDNYLFNCTVRENIRLGNPEATDEEVVEAAKKACCHEFIMEMENGYDTLVGETGGKLSGGERQRIAIARMILRNSPIVILDEATAFTDPENEEKIQEAINNLAKGKTLLVIAHRLSTIKDADRIFILENGRIADSGTHEELLEKSGLYRKMWTSHIGAKAYALEGRR